MPTYRMTATADISVSTLPSEVNITELSAALSETYGVTVFNVQCIGPTSVDDEPESA